MKKIFAILAITVVAMVVCFSSISVGAASKNSPAASTAKPKPTTTTRPRNTNNNPSNPTGNPVGGGDHNGDNASTVNPQDDSSEWFRTSTTNPNGGNGDNNGGGNGTDGTNGTGGSTTSPVTGDYVVYSVLIAAGLGLSSLFAYKKYTSKKK